MRVELIGRLTPGSERGIELLYLGPDGYYHPSFRFYGVDAARQMDQWYELNPGRRQNTRLREITRTTPPYDPNEDRDDEEEQDDMPASPRGYDEGKEMGADLAAVFTMNPSADQQAIFDLAWTFAKFAGFADADGAKNYVRGFAAGISQSPKLLTAPSGAQ